MSNFTTTSTYTPTKEEEFLALARSLKGSGYIRGANGEIYTMSMLQSAVREMGRKFFYFLGYSAEKWIDAKRDFDCSGLIVYLLRTLGYVNPNFDDTAEGLMNLCIEIPQYELRPGDLCFRGDPINHIAIFIENKLVIHAKGTKYGVVETNELDTFTRFGRLRWFYTVEDVITSNAAKLISKETGINIGYWYSVSKYFPEFLYKQGQLFRKWGKM